MHDVRTASKRLWKDDDRVLLDVLTDDVIALICEFLLCLECEPGEGPVRRAAARAGARDVLNLGATCRTASAILYAAGACEDVAREVAARAIDLVPRGDGVDESFLYTRMAKRHAFTARQVEALRLADEAMALHCGGRCCAAARLCASSAIRAACGGGRVLPLGVDVRELAVSSEANVVYTINFGKQVKDAEGCKRKQHVVERTDLDAPDASGRCAMAIAGAAFELADGHKGPSPGRIMASSPRGAYLAFDSCFALETDAPVDEGVCVWHAASGRVVTISSSEAVDFDISQRGFTDVPALFSTAWPAALHWQSEHELTVFWTSTPVSPGGRDDLGNGPVYAAERFVMAQYAIEHKGSGGALGVTFLECFGTYHGRLISVAGVHGGAILCTIRNCAPRLRGEALYSLLLVDHVGGRAATLPTDPSIDNVRASSAPCVAVSHDGQYAAVSHSTHFASRVDIFECVGNGAPVSFGFRRIASHMLAMPPIHAAAPRGVRTEVRLQHMLAFSPCGGFLVVVDARARWGHVVPDGSHAIHVLKLSKLLGATKLPSVLVAHCRGAPRSDLRIGGHTVRVSAAARAATPPRNLAFAKDHLVVLAHGGASVITI